MTNNGKILYFILIFHDYLKKKIEPFITGIYFISLILIVSVYSLLISELRIVIFDKRADTYIIHSNEAIFFIFLIEFLLSCLFEDKFNFSFFFWIDLISLISFITETDFIWNNISNLITSNNIQSKEITKNEYLERMNIATNASST